MVVVSSPYALNWCFSYPLQHNVLINDDGKGVLADFGRSKLIDHRGYTTSFAGSSRYLAPELLEYVEELGIDDYEDSVADDPMPNLTKQTDVYAFSMVIIEVNATLLSLCGMNLTMLHGS